MKITSQANKHLTTKSLKNKIKPKLAQRFKAVTHMTPTSERARRHLIDTEGYDPVHMYKVLSKTPVPTQQEWSMRLKKVDEFVQKVTTASFLDKYRLER